LQGLLGTWSNWIDLIGVRGGGGGNTTGGGGGGAAAAAATANEAVHACHAYELRVRDADADVDAAAGARHGAKEAWAPQNTRLDHHGRTSTRPRLSTLQHDSSRLLTLPNYSTAHPDNAPTQHAPYLDAA
jgi:hypothetical protein